MANLSSSDGLDEQLRKLYRTHLTDTNPFGEDESPTQFDVLDSLTKVIFIRAWYTSDVSVTVLT
jgi:hypothetical protein